MLFELKQLEPCVDEIKAILKESDDLMSALYPPESNDLLSAESLQANNVYFIGAFNQAKLLACGALVCKEDDGCYGELKRVYVKAPFRRKGISKHIVQSLLAHGQKQGLNTIRLELGNKQPEALSLYKQFGFYERTEFGNYRYDPVSIYMELKLSL